MKDLKKNMNKYVILLVIIVAIYIIYGIFTRDYIDNIDVKVSASNNGKLEVVEKLDYVLHKDNNEIILPIHVIANTNLLNNMIFFNNNFFEYKENIKNVNVKVKTEKGEYNLFENHKDEDNKKQFKLVRLNNLYYGIKLPVTFDRGNVSIRMKYEIGDSITQFNDISQIYFKFSDKINKYKYNNFNLSVNLYNLKPQLSRLYINKSNRIYNEKKSIYNIGYSDINIKRKSDFNIRLLFNSKINAGFKQENIEMLPLLDEYMETYNTNLNREDTFVIILVILIILLIIYYIKLLLTYDYNKFKEISAPSYDEIVDKINPIVAACLIGEREFETKDVMACIMSMIAKGYIKVNKYTKLQIYKKLDETGMDKKKIDEKLFDAEEEIFELEKSLPRDKNIKLDEVEDRIYDMIFRDSNSVLLHEELKDINNNPIKKSTLQSIKEYINDLLFKMGAKRHVPRFIHFINLLLFFNITIFSMYVILQTYGANKVVKEIFYSYNFMRYTSIDSLLIFLQNIMKIMFILAIIQIVFYIIIYFIYFIVYVFDKIFKNTVKYLLKTNYDITDGKSLMSIVSTLKKGVQTLNVMSVITLVMYLFVPSYITLLAMIPVSLIAIIFNSSTVMQRHTEECERLYLGIYILFDKLKNGSLLKEKTFKDNVLWDKYLAFAFAFGISNDDVIKVDQFKLIGGELKSIFEYMIKNSLNLSYDEKSIKNKLKKRKDFENFKNFF